MKKRVKQFSKRGVAFFMAAAMVGTSLGSMGTTERAQAADEPQPVMELKFDETSGITALDSVSGSSWDIEGTAEFVEGEIGNALYFSGNTKIYVPEESEAYDFNIQPNYTVSAWIRPDATGTGTSQTIMSRQIEGSYTNSWIWGEHNGKMYFQHGTSDGQGAEPMNGTLAGGEWQHVAVTAEDDLITFYINGESVGTYTVNDRANRVELDGMPLLIGDKVAIQARPFIGAIDELKVYETTLSEEEIRSQYEYNVNPFTMLAQNGQLVLAFENPLTETPTAEDFTVTMTNSVVDPTETKPVELVNCTVEGQNVTLEFDPVTAVGADQTIDISVTYNRVVREAQFVVPKFEDENLPTVSNVKIEGTPTVKDGLSLTYDYEDIDGEEEGRSKIEWWISPEGDIDGEYTKIEGVRTKDIYLISYYTNRYLKASVTPVNEKYAAGETVMSEPIGPVVNNGNENVEWFRDAEYGIMHHFLHDYITLAAVNEEEELKPEENWDAYLDTFDVDAYVQDVLATGADFVIFTIGQHDGYFNAHNPVYDKYAGVEEGERTPASDKRDLPMEIAKALEPYGIKMMFYAVGCPPFRAHKEFGPNFDHLTNPFDGDYGITDAFGQTRNTDTPPSQETLRKWQEVLGYWSEHYGEYLAGWWIDGMWTSGNSLRGNTYEVNPDMTPNPNADPNAAYAPTNEYNWHTWVDQLKKGNPDRIISMSLGGSDEINVPYEDYVGGEAHSNANFNSVAPRNPANSQVDGWANKEMGVQWFFMSSMGTPNGMYGYWGQPGAYVDTEQVAGWFKNNVEKNAVLVSDSRVNRFGRIDTEQMEQWKRVKAVVDGTENLKPMETYNDHWYFTQFYDKDGNNTTDWTYVGDGNYYNSDYTYTVNNESYFEFEFCGTGVEFYTAETPEMGEVDIYIDGEFKETVNLYSDGWQYQQKVYEISGLEEGLHTIKGVKKSGDKLVVDYFKVLGEVERPIEIDKTALTEKIAEAKEKAAQTDVYTEESIANLNAAIEEAEKVLETAATQEEIDNAAAELQKAIDSLEEKGVSKNTLEYFLNSAKEHVANGDTEGLVESVQKLFEEAIDEGEAVMADENATRDEVMNATLKLVKAIHALDMKAADKTDLEMAVELGDMIDLSKYVEEGQKEFTDALAAAKEVLADGDAMQGDVDAAWDALVTAMENLRLKANKDALEDLLDEVSGLDLSQYTEESAAAFRTALASAQTVFADETLSEDDQQTVDAAVKVLADAKEQLVLKEENQGGSGEGNTETSGGDSSGNNGQEQGSGNTDNAGSDNRDSGTADGNSANKAAKTGDDMNLALWAGVLAGSVLLTCGAVIFVRRRRKY